MNFHYFSPKIALMFALLFLYAMFSLMLLPWHVFGAERKDISTEDHISKKDITHKIVQTSNDLDAPSIIKDVDLGSSTATTTEENAQATNTATTTNKAVATSTIATTTDPIVSTPPTPKIDPTKNTTALDEFVSSVSKSINPLLSAFEPKTGGYNIYTYSGFNTATTRFLLLLGLLLGAGGISLISRDLIRYIRSQEFLNLNAFKNYLLSHN